METRIIILLTESIVIVSLFFFVNFSKAIELEDVDVDFGNKFKQKRIEYLNSELQLWIDLNNKSNNKPRNEKTQEVFNLHQKFCFLYDYKDIQPLIMKKLTNSASYFDVTQMAGISAMSHINDLFRESCNIDPKNVIFYIQLAEKLDTGGFHGEGMYKIFEYDGLALSYAFSIISKSDLMCETQQPFQQIIYQFYIYYAATDLQGYMMKQLSYMLLYIYTSGRSNIKESNKLRKKFNRFKISYLWSMHNIMPEVRAIWRCDPVQHKKGVTYEEITRLLQGYIENETDMDPHESCAGNCEDYTTTKHYKCYDKTEYCMRQPQCKGKLVNCQFIESSMTICPAASNSSRRYEFIEYYSGRVLGNKDSCTEKTDTAYSWNRGLVQCSYCLCMCDEQGSKSDRYFSLRPSVSDIEQNMVVTGVRLRKENQIFHLQIQQGQLSGREGVSASTVSWRSIDIFNTNSENVKDSIDFHTLTSEKRAVLLGNIIEENENFVVTGVKFTTEGNYLKLSVRVTELNVKEGKLNPVNSVWKTDYITGKTDLKLQSPDISTKNPTRSVRPTSRMNHFIKFTNTDLDKDAGQNTVPFIDLQEVVSNPPELLSGIGIYYRGSEGYGGFIAPLIMPRSYKNYA